MHSSLMFDSLKQTVINPIFSALTFDHANVRIELIPTQGHGLCINKIDSIAL